ncbi:MAG: gliding motility-associated C-terminal domain-containing protein [Bacteroidota bacterium]
MKRIITYSLLFICQVCPAQIIFSLEVNDVGCQHSYLGNAKITVNQTNPPYSYLWSTGAITPSISNLEHGVYTVTVTDASSKDTVVKVIIRELECGMDPSAFFTPNGDGYNDEWSISNAYLFPDALILVYNRWGQKVYEHSGLYDMAWNGEDLFGVPVPDASYYYIIYKDRKKKSDMKKGSLSILR